MSKTPRTDAVWERFRTDLSLEPEDETNNTKTY